MMIWEKRAKKKVSGGGSDFVRFGARSKAHEDVCALVEKHSKGEASAEDVAKLAVESRFPEVKLKAADYLLSCAKDDPACLDAAVKVCRSGDQVVVKHGVEKANELGETETAARIAAPREKKEEAKAPAAAGRAATPAPDAVEAEGKPAGGKGTVADKPATEAAKPAPKELPAGFDAEKFMGEIFDGLKKKRDFMELVVLASGAELEAIVAAVVKFTPPWDNNISFDRKIFKYGLMPGELAGLLANDARTRTVLLQGFANAGRWADLTRLGIAGSEDTANEASAIAERMGHGEVGKKIGFECEQTQRRNYTDAPPRRPHFKGP